MAGMNLSIVPGIFGIYRYPAGAGLPNWVSAGGFYSITKTDEELSIVCLVENEPVQLPDQVQVTRGWQMYKVAGPLDFSLIGILASLAQPLAEAGIPIFVVSTFDTDYLLIDQDKFEQAAGVLTKAGHQIIVL